MKDSLYSPLALVLLFAAAVVLIPDLPPGSGLIIGLLCVLLVKVHNLEKRLDGI